MPALILLAVVLGCAWAADDGPSPWRQDLAAGIAEARGDGTVVKPMALLFTTRTCTWCHRMMEESAAHPELMQIFAEVVPIEVEAEEHRALTASFAISSFPTLIQVNRKGELVRSLSGYLPPTDLVTTLRVLVMHGDGDGVRPAGLTATVDLAAIRRRPDGAATLVGMLGAGDVETRRALRDLLATLPEADDALWQALTAQRLGVRVDAAAVLAAKVGEPGAYDPFAPSDQRAAAAAQWRKTSGGRIHGGVVP